MDTNYDYMKTLLPLPNHSVALHPMSGGGHAAPLEKYLKRGLASKTMHMVLEDSPHTPPAPILAGGDNKEGDNLNNTFHLTNFLLPDNAQELPTDTQINQPSASGPTSASASAPVSEQSSEQSSEPTKDSKQQSEHIFELDGSKYIIKIEGDKVTNLADLNLFLEKYHINELAEDKQNEFILSIIKCGGLDALIEGNKCDALISNIQHLISAIVNKYNGIIDAPPTAPGPAVAVTAATAVFKIEEIDKNNYKECIVNGDGWCLYRALIRGEALINNISDVTCDNNNKNIEYENEQIPILLKAISEYIGNEEHLNEKYKGNDFEPEEKSLKKYILEHIYDIIQKTNLIEESSGYIEQQIYYSVITKNLSDENKKNKSPDLIKQKINDNSGELITIFKDNIPKYNDQNDINKGPTIWGMDIIIGHIFMKIKRINVEIYQSCDEPHENKYCLINKYKDDTNTNTIRLVGKNNNHFDLLVKKPESSTPPQQQPASTTQPQAGGAFKYKLRRRLQH